MASLKAIGNAYQEVVEFFTLGVGMEDNLEGLVLQVTQHEQVRRQQNLMSVLSRAQTYVGENHVSDHEPDPDWTSRFFSDVQDVSSDGMQALWAKILVGEIERPGSTSIRTLGLMKDLDKPTAVIFRRLCSIALSFSSSEGDIVDCRASSLGKDAGKNALQDYGLSFHELNVLNEYGLIIADYNSWQNVPYPYPFQFQSRTYLLSSEPLTKTGAFKMSGVALTKSGRELSRVVEQEPDTGQVVAYSEDLIRYIQSNGLTLTPISVPCGCRKLGRGR